MPKPPIHNTPAKILGLSPEELEKIKEQFPYFNSARMLLLKKHQNSGEASERELSSSAVWSSDRKKMHDFLKKRARSEYPPLTPKEETKPIEQESYKAQEIAPEPIAEEVAAPVIEAEAREEETPVLSSVIVQEESAEVPIIAAPTIEATSIIEEITPEAEEVDPEEEEAPLPISIPETRKFIIADHTFDEWLDHFKRGKHSVRKLIEDKPKAAEEAADELNRLIESSLPATFFHDKLESETQYAKGLENFIDVQKKKKASLNKPAETGLVTETLAKIYEGQGLVDKAIGIYGQLILKNPEKSAYFAVQIERLKNK